jgi:hypothetical protein
MWLTVQRNGYTAGRYAIHYRDETTNKTLLFSTYPTRTIRDQAGCGLNNAPGNGGDQTPSVSGTAPPSWDVPHSPQLGYMAYLITGRFYHVETVQFEATFNYLAQGADLNYGRNGALNIFEPYLDGQDQTRARAWNMRALALALSATPDSDTALRGEFKTSVQANIDRVYSRYIAQTNNIMGWVQPGEDGYVGSWRVGAPWQQDFVTAAWGYLLTLGLPLDAGYQTKAAGFFAWKAQSIIGRLGLANVGFDWRFASQYDMTFSVANYPDYRNGTAAGFYSDWASLYADAKARSASTFDNSASNALGGNTPPGAGASSSFWANLQPAIAYAVRHAVPGALVSYGRMTNANNWASFASSIVPVWSVIPATGAAPLWSQGKALNEWFQIAGTSTGLPSGADAYGGWTFKEDTSELISTAVGGHGDGSDNGVYSITLTDDVPSWVTRTSASPVRPADVAYCPDGKPAARHTYQTVHWVPELNRVMMFGAIYTSGSAVTFPAVDGWNPSTNMYDPAGTYPNTPDGTGSWNGTSWPSNSGGYSNVVAYDRTRGEYWLRQLTRWRPSIGYDSPVTGNPGQSVGFTFAWDCNRDELFSLVWGNGQDDLGRTPGTGLDDRADYSATVMRRGTLTATVITFNASSALTQFRIDCPGYAGMCYDPINACYYHYNGRDIKIGSVSIPSTAGRLYKITPNVTDVWDISIVTQGSGSVAPPVTATGGINSRIAYIPALKGVVIQPTRSSGLYFMRTS